MKNFTTYNYNIACKVASAALWCFMLATFVACHKSPTDGVSLIVNTNIIKYSANITIRDAANNTIIPTNVQLSISGDDADNIYEISGKKDFTLHNGSIQIGVNPILTPAKGRPVSFNLEISADGYLPLTQEVQMANGQLTQDLNISMLNISNPPPGINLVQQDVDASGGSLVNDEAVKVGDGQAPFTASTQQVTYGTTPGVLYSDNALATVILPAGTSFYYMKNIKTGTFTGTNKIPVYAKQDTTVYDTVTTKPNVAPITGTGITAFTPAPTTTITAHTYFPIVDYYNVEYTYNVYKTVRVAFRGSVHVVCQYYTATNYPPNANLNSYSCYNYGTMTNSIMRLINNTTVYEDELLYSGAAKMIVSGIYFTGKVNGKNMVISPNKDINGNTDQSITWRTSIVLDPTVINPYTNNKIQAGDSIDVGIDYQHHKTLHGIIQKVKGQLRVENRTGSAGFYHRAKYVQTYNFSIASDRQNDIPDQFNINGNAWVNFGGSGPVIPLNFYCPINGLPGQTYYFGGKGISDQPLNAPTIQVFTTYFDKQISTNISAKGGSVAAFTGLTNLNPESDIAVSLTCTGDPSKPITVKPTYNYYLQYQYNINAIGLAYGYAFQFDGGTFKTKGFAPGYTINYNSYVGDTNIAFQYKVNPGLNPISLNFGYKDNKICNTF